MAVYTQAAQFWADRIGLKTNKWDQNWSACVIAAYYDSFTRCNRFNLGSGWDFAD